MRNNVDLDWLWLLLLGLDGLLLIVWVLEFELFMLVCRRLIGLKFSLTIGLKVLWIALMSAATFQPQAANAFVCTTSQAAGSIPLGIQLVAA